MSEVVGRERRVVRRQLDEEQVKAERAKVSRTFEDARLVQNNFKTFKDWAEPRIRRALDPAYKNDDLEGEEKLSIDAARGLDDELTHRRKLKGSQIGKLKAERRLAFDACANGFRYEVVEVELVKDLDALEMHYVDPAGTIVDRRALTAEERQMELDGAGTKKGKKGKGAPAAVH